MLPEIALESLRFFDRTALEELQMHSRYMRDFIKSHTRSLPLRNNYKVVIECGGVDIQLSENKRAEIEVVAPSDQDLNMLFHRVNNAFIHGLTLSFLRADLPLPYHLRAYTDDLQCHIGALRIEDFEEEEVDGGAVEIDYTLVAFIGGHLKPKIYEITMRYSAFQEEYVMLFNSRALRGSITHLVYEMFEAYDRETDIVRSVTLLYTRTDESPLRHDVAPLGQPRRTNASTPHSAFIKQWYLEEHPYGTYSVSAVAELFLFENAKSAKKMEVYVWTIAIHDSLHYA